MPTQEDLPNRPVKASLFRVQRYAGNGAPVMTSQELPEAWTHLEQRVLGRTLLVNNRADCLPEQIEHASGVQSHNERLFRA